MHTKVWAVNPFSVFNIPPTFELDGAELDRRYRALQQALHPDRFARSSPSERQVSLSKSVTVNEAYRSLRDEVQRAELAFSVLSEQPGEGRGQSSADAVGQEFLMEVMELGEAVTEAALDPSQREGVMQQLQELTDEVRESLRQSLRPDRFKNSKEEAQQSVARFRYLHRLREQLQRASKAASESVITAS